MIKRPCLLFVFGTRPECIKMAPLILEAEKRALPVLTCFTGQHQEMATPILKFFNININYSLQIMRPGQSLNQISAEIFTKLQPVLAEKQIDHIIVQGDTTTAAVTALMGFQSSISVVHIEAGLRTNNLKSPWPEEFNRRMISLAARWHFAPTNNSVQNLIKENVPKDSIFEVGNTGIDALRLVSEKITKENKFKNPTEFLVLVTLHRRENFGPELENMMGGIKKLCRENHNIKVVWPLHQNPNVKKAFDEVFKEKLDNMIVLEPMNYFDFVSVMNEADLIVTDSGGVQEEAPFLGKPILVCRKNTERPESIDCGSAKLIGTSKEKLIAEVLNLYSNKAEYAKMAGRRSPYGDGHASEKIIDILLS